MAISTAAASNDPITGALGLRPGEQFVLADQFAKPHVSWGGMMNRSWRRTINGSRPATR
jgi:hypothetical protein